MKWIDQSDIYLVDVRTTYPSILSPALYVEASLTADLVTYQKCQTQNFGSNEKVINELKAFAENRIFGRPIEFEDHWSGIIATGGSKTPILKRLDDRTYAAVRLGGMGVAITLSLFLYPPLTIPIRFESIEVIIGPPLLPPLKEESTIKVG